MFCFQDQVTLRILPTFYPFHLGLDDEDDKTGEKRFTEKMETIEPYDDQYEQEAQVVYRIFAKIFKKQANTFIPYERLEEQDLIGDWKEEKEELIRKEAPLEQKLIQEYRDIFS